MEKKITDTLQAKIITILGDYLEHDADGFSDCSLALLELVDLETLKAFDKGYSVASKIFNGKKLVSTKK